MRWGESPSESGQVGNRQLLSRMWSDWACPGKHYSKGIGMGNLSHDEPLQDEEREQECRQCGRYFLTGGYGCPPHEVDGFCSDKCDYLAKEDPYSSEDP